MSKQFLDFVNNLVDREDSEYYLINKRKRDYWHSKSTTFSFRVRETNDFNRSKDIVFNIRAFLLGECEPFFNEVIRIWKKVRESDGEQFRNYIYSTHPEGSREELDKNMGLYVGSLSDEEKKGVLGLDTVISCRLLGYEKELFCLKCYCHGPIPVVMGRVLYHVKFDHFKYIDSLPEDFEEGIDIGIYLARINFL